MQVSIALDQPGRVYTNMDIISGQVVVRNPTPTGITEITVKLEGESASRLIAAPLYAGDKERPLAEVHKLLYKTVTVFPDPAIHSNIPGKASQFYLDSGVQSFPFRFKFPFNNVCHELGDINNKMGLIGRSIEATRTGNNHIKTTLPPSLFQPPDCEIRYYVKATVRRPQILKENPRAHEPISFIPIEPPRPTNLDGEAYGRRQHVFSPQTPVSPSGRKGSFFSGLNRKSEQASGSSDTLGANLEPPRVSVEARLPNPAILTCNKDLPLKIIYKLLSDATEQIYLQSLQIELIGYTNVRAHDASKQMRNSWIICTHSNMGVPLGPADAKAGSEVALSKEYWYQHPLPSSVAPTFTACNVARLYEVEVRVGLSLGPMGKGKAEQYHVIPIRLGVKVFSGIAPTQAILDTMIADQNRPSTPQQTNLPSWIPQVRPPQPPSSSSQSHSPNPSSSTSSFASSNPPLPLRPGHASRPPRLPGYTEAASSSQGPVSAYDAPLQNAYNDPPPSYEDAMSDAIPPIDGPRPNYTPPAPQGGGGRIIGGSGESWAGPGAK